MHNKITVIIPTFNSLSTIERALTSVISQSLKPHELIIIDDCSTDGTYELLLKYKENFNSPIELKILKNSVNSGPSVSRNRGIKVSAGNWIAFLDSDDSWHNKKLEIQLKIAIKYHCDFLGTVSRVGEPDQMEEINELDLKLTHLSLSDFYWKNYFQTPTVFVKKSEFLVFDSKMKYAEDFNLWLKLMSIYEHGILIKAPLVFLGKEAFGVSGLSQNLYLMEKGELMALGQIKNPLMRSLSKLFSILKYFRRVVITQFRT